MSARQLTHDWPTDVCERLRLAYGEDMVAVELDYEGMGQPPPPYWLLNGHSQVWYALVAGWLLDNRGIVVEVREPYPGEREGRAYDDVKALHMAVQYASDCGASA